MWGIEKSNLPQCQEGQGRYLWCFFEDSFQLLEYLKESKKERQRNWEGKNLKGEFRFNSHEELRKIFKSEKQTVLQVWNLLNADVKH